MDIARVFVSLRPNPAFTHNMVNFFSLETVGRTFQGAMPTPEEMDAEWLILQTQDNDVDYQKTKKADIEKQFDDTLKAFSLVLLSEINILRVAAGLPERTVKQLKAAVKIKL
jgi:hypothetical protein